MVNGAPTLFGKGAVDPSLDQLFSTSLVKEPLKTKPAPQRSVNTAIGEDDSEEDEDDPQPEDSAEIESADEDDEDDADNSPNEATSADEEASSDDEDDESAETAESEDEEPEVVAQIEVKQAKKKRKREDENSNLESKYLAKLAAEEEKGSKRQKAEDGKPVAVNGDGEANESDATSEESEFEIPKHETQDGSAKTNEVEQANRTVFLGNVSTDAIKSKASLRELKSHLVSFLEADSGDKPDQHIESIRFRSTAFTSTAVPRKAAYVKKDLMDATTKSTNAYVVYNTAAIAKTVVKKLNGTVVLDRHLRVDSVAHPAAVDHRRCVFVGNLGFVDDESLMHDNGDEEQKPKKKKAPGDAEEGLWRQFGKAGSVESVRVIRDKSTRVGKGFAYVQFTDQVAVEKALEFNEKKFPPLLPRVLRVTRAKKMTKTNSYKDKQGPGRPPADAAANSKVYNPKIAPEVKSAQGRAGKLFGRAGAAQFGKSKKGGDAAGGMRRPEDFVFEGHRARDAEGMGLTSMKKKGGKPQTRSSRRGAAFKASGRKK